MKPYYQCDQGKLFNADALEALKQLPDKSVNCGITSPPYWGLRDYGEDSQLGLEETPEEYIKKLVAIFKEFKRVLRDDGTLWLNLGDSYNTTSGFSRASPDFYRKGREGGSADKKAIKHDILKKKDLVGIPWRVAFALQTDGWYLRQDIIWHKPNPMPESVTDRCTKAHEYIFLLSKSPKYYFDNEMIKEPTNTRDKNIRDRETTKLNNTPGRKRMNGLVNNNYQTRNKRSVWRVTTKPFKDAHFATFPPDLILPCVLAGCPEGGVILDMFFGAGTTGLVALENKRKFIGIELSQKYCDIAANRLNPIASQISF